MNPSNSSVPSGWSIEEKTAPGDCAVHDPLLGAFPDIILKSQFFDLVSRRQLSGEQRLMLAVLVDAINILRCGNRWGSERNDNPFAEARDWILESECGCPLAFEHVCDALGIDAPTLRRRISSMISGAPDALAVPRRLRLTAGSRVRRLTVADRPPQPSRRTRDRQRRIARPPERVPAAVVLYAAISQDEGAAAANPKMEDGK